LATIVGCNTPTSTFNYGLGRCSATDQKWKDYTISVNFINGLTPNNYVLEVYFQLTGSDIYPAIASKSFSRSFVFTPTSNLNCEVSFTYNLTVNQILTPSFRLPNQLFQYATTPTLQSKSNNGITGTWNPTIVSTNANGSYVFTPNNPSQCAIGFTYNKTITPKITSTFPNIDPIC
jgi:hypothetical protein